MQLKYKYLEVNPKICRIYYENAHTYKTLSRMIKQDQNKWGDISCCWISKFNIGKISILPKLIYGFNTTAIKSLMGFFLELDKGIWKLMWKNVQEKVMKNTWKKQWWGGGKSLWTSTFVIALIIKPRKIIQYIVRPGF